MKHVMGRWVRLAVIVGALFARAAFAREAASEVSTEEPPNTRKGIVDRSHDRVSSGVEAFINRVDGLFAGNESLDSPTGSYLRAGTEVALRRPKHGGNDMRGFISAKIRLPRTNDRLQLVVDQGIESITRSESQKEAARSTQGVNNDEDDLFVGLRGIVAETLKVNLTSDVGIRFRGLTVDPYVRGHALRLFEVGSWKIPLSETLLWRRQAGFTAASELGFLREMDTDTVFSAVSNATFVEDTSDWSLSQVFSVSRRLDGRALLAYEAGIFGRTDPRTEVTTYTLAVRYRRKFLRDWIIGEIRPQLTFPRDHDYDVVPSLTMRVEAYFGKGTLPEP